MPTTAAEAPAKTSSSKSTPKVPAAESLPNFLIIGAQKSGTTTLAEVLDRHPDVHISRPKEPHYLAYGDRLQMAPFPDAISNSRVPATTLAEYRACFAAGDGAAARGEASPSSMPMRRALERAVDLLGKPKVIAILRQPADRAYSNYTHVVSRHGESCRTFADAVAAESGRVGAGWGPLWHYVGKGFYHRQLLPWIEALGKKNVKVVLFEDLKGDPAKLYRELFEFLEVNPDFAVETNRQSNATRVARNKVLEKMIRTLRPAVSGPLSLLPKNLSRGLKAAVMAKPKVIDPELRDKLTEGYREDIFQLEDLIDRDLSGWFEA